MAASIGSAAIVTAVFKDAAAVERAYHATLARGYAPGDISLVMSEETRRQHFNADQVATDLADKAATSTEKKHPSAQELGGPAGGTAATLAPALAAAGTAALLPGLILAGPIAVALVAAGAVAVAGGVAGALTNWGVPKTRVQDYEAHIHQGGILIGVNPRSEEEARALRQEWQSAGGTLVLG
jgi:hypothetical protein